MSVKPQKKPEEAHDETPKQEPGGKTEGRKRPSPTGRRTRMT